MDEDALQPVLDPTSLSPPQMTAWPWLHEDLFFQNDKPNDWLQPLMHDPRDSGSSVDPTLLDGISGHAFNMSSPSIANHFSQDLLRHAVVEEIPQHVTENGAIQPMEHQTSTLFSDKNGASSHSKLSKGCPLLVQVS